jgi:hypothetical protein
MEKGFNCNNFVRMGIGSKSVVISEKNRIMLFILKNKKIEK